MNALLAFFLLFSGAAGSFKLPARAKITIQTAHAEAGYSPEQYGTCSERKITKRELRRYFATYHETKGDEFTHGYMDIACVIEGDIQVGNRHFHFAERPINLLETTWPDGKLHLLGGKHSDETDDSLPVKR